MQSAEDVIKERLQVEGQVKADVGPTTNYFSLPPWCLAPAVPCPIAIVACFLNHPMQVANAYTGSFDAFRKILQHDAWLS